jgi:hypothetical protein
MLTWFQQLISTVDNFLSALAGGTIGDGHAPIAVLCTRLWTVSGRGVVGYRGSPMRRSRSV